MIMLPGWAAERLPRRRTDDGAVPERGPVA